MEKFETCVTYFVSLFNLHPCSMSHTMRHASLDAHSVIHLRPQTPGGHSLYSVQVLLHDEWGSSGLFCGPGLKEVTPR